MLDDNEARYLIDQFNKYASWSTARIQFYFSEWTSSFAASALCIAILSLFAANASVAVTYRTIVLGIVAPFSLIIVVGGGAVSVFRDLRKAKEEQEECEGCFLALEEHRSKYKSLPDGLTLTKIVESELDELKKLLKESEQEIARHGRLYSLFVKGLEYGGIYALCV